MRFNETGLANLTSACLRAGYWRRRLPSNALQSPARLRGSRSSTAIVMRPRTIQHKISIYLHLLATEAHPLQ